jgi:ATP-binding cassette subfamily C protein
MTSFGNARITEGLASAALLAGSSAWIHVGVFSVAFNLLMFAGSIYMLQIYDRVLASRSIATLVGLSVILLAAYMLQAALDASRMRLLARIGSSADETLRPVAVNLVLNGPTSGRSIPDSLQALRDLDALRGFLSGLGPTAIIDLPFLPLFVAACFVLHPWLGLLTLFGAAGVIAFTFATERLSRKDSLSAERAVIERQMRSETAVRASETVVGLGMSRPVADAIQLAHERMTHAGVNLADSGSSIGATAKAFRMFFQSAVLGLGAYLAIRGELSPGAMIAASILASRALAPVETAVANWKGFAAARRAIRRLDASLPAASHRGHAVDLPKPCKHLDVVALSAGAPQNEASIIQGVSFRLEAGQALGVIGPSGSGKSTLARALAGVWPSQRGEIRLDGALIRQWPQERYAKFLGYLPQTADLLDGSISQNIARFSPVATSDQVLEAARLAGAHDMIVAFPKGYDTPVGPTGAQLSGGERQRIALARALFGDPFVLVLDEPNSQLDAVGDAALSAAIQSVKARGAIVIVITHRPSALAATDMVMAMSDGRVQAFGPRDEVLRQVTRKRPDQAMALDKAVARAPEGTM